MTTRRRILGAALSVGSGLAGAAAWGRTARAEDAAQPREYPVVNRTELDTALGLVRPGDSIVLQDGTWHNVHVVVAGAGGPWPAASHGLPGAPITLRAQTRGGVTFTGVSWINLARNHWILDGFRFRDGRLTNGDHGVIHLGLPMVGHPDRSGAEANHCEVTHCSIKDYNPPLANSQYNWVRLMGTNNTISWSHFSGKNHMLDMVSAHWRKSFPGVPTRHRFHHNYFGDISPTSSNGFGALTPVMGRPSGVTDQQWPDLDDGIVIEDNLFHACNGESEIISVKSSGNVVRRNTFIDCLGYVNLRQGHRNEVSSNYIFGGNLASDDAYFPGGVPVGESGGIRVSGEQHRIFNNYIHGVHGSGIWIQNGSSANAWYGYLPVKDLMVVNNTIVDPGRSAITIGAGISRVTAAPGIPGGGDNVVPEDLTFANNLLVGRAAGALVQYGRWPWALDPSAPAEQTIPVDVVWQGNLAHAPVVHDGTVPSGITVDDPRMVPAGWDQPVWRPGAGSPAIDAAVGRYPYLNHDIEGRPRPRVGDVGAHEIAGGTARNRPLARADVGPDYATDE